MSMRKVMCVLLAMLCLLTPLSLADQTYTASTPLDGSSARKHNIKLAVAAIDGWELDAGETFSFNNVVGERSRDRGYETATNGRGAKVIGGGVAQVASTLYLALLKIDDVEFTKLTTYGSKFVEDYVSSGSLAVVTDYDAGTDFRFKNNISDMEIDMWVSGNTLNCSITVEDEGNWFSSYSAHGSVDIEDNDEKTMNNVLLAAGSVYDTTLASGDVFSFNKVVGPRTKEYGYTTGTNGRGAKVTGGGVAQVASAVWLAVKDRSDVAILEKSTYGKKYNQDYVDSSADAIVTDYKSGQDFSFRYTGSGTMTLYTYVEDDDLLCDIVIN